MTTKKTSLLLVFCAALLAGYGCNHNEQHTQSAAPNTFTIKGTVREMHINPESPQFPDSAGKSEFVSYCSMCHSLKYITMQPNFPAKTWRAEVTKMITKYKAPIDSVMGKKIADYLVAVKGAKG